MKVLALSTLVLAVALAQAAAPPTIHLPPDAEVVTIVGNNFRLNVTQLVKMQEDWKAVAEDLEKDRQAEQKVDGTNGTDGGADGTDDGTNGIDDGANGGGENGKPEDGDNSVDGQNGGEGAEGQGEKDYGLLEEDLHTWIEDRATALADRVERYSEEVGTLRQGQRVVSQVLLLNTLHDLENLTKENIKSLKWIKNKLRWIMAVRDGVSSEVSNFVASKIEENEKIEPKVRGKNDPGNKWITNTQAIKRIMHEQRFSEPIRESIVKFLGGEFNMMERSRVYDINKPAKILDDGLYYYLAKGRIPAYFPFFSQDSIINGAQL